MRVAILSIAVLSVVVGAVGLVSPTFLISFRRRRLVTRRGLYVTAVFRVAVGLLFILFAPASRMPLALRVLGAMVCVQGLVQGFGRYVLSTERMQAMLDWEAARPGLLRIGAMIALVFGGFVAFAATAPAP
jgi:hypothetical protein